jgi:uncharacterized protein (DUF362 family)
MNRIGGIAKGIDRRQFLKALAGSWAALSTGVLSGSCSRQGPSTAVFIGKVQKYEAEIASVILDGLKELGITRAEIEGKRILLKPNLVEPHAGLAQINTHPFVVHGAIEAFKRLGAALVIVGEGPGHYRDTHLVLEESGLSQVLSADRVAFHNLNDEAWCSMTNLGRTTKLKELILPVTLKQVDWIVSMPKLKTHHWAGVTLSMKNLFGVMPGMFYGWPKNVLHWEGIDKSIADINATVKPHFAIVDGVIGMEGDGPIMGKPKQVGALIMGRNLVAVDATCSRVMGIDPRKVRHLSVASKRLGPIRETSIAQRGETLGTVRKDFELLDHIPALKGLRLK